MLRLVLGRSGSGKSAYVLEKAVQYDPEKVLLVVPEQFTLETEKRLLDAFCTDALPAGTVTSFSEMATSYISLHAPAGRYINNFGRRVLMSRALKKQNDALAVYGGRVTRSLADAFVSVVSELKTSCIAPDELMAKSADFAGTAIGDKLHDIAIVAGEYNSLMSGSYLDSLDDLTALAEGIRKHDLYRGKTVIFDGFHNYSAQEERVIAAIMEQAAEVIITVPCSSVTDMGTEPDGGVFENVRADVRRILGAASRLDIPVAPAVILKENRRAKTEELRVIESSLISGTTTCDACNGISLYSTPTAAEETELLSSLILRDVRENGCKFSDCAVISRSLTDYEAILPHAFSRAGIPFYMDTREDVTLRPLFSLMISALKIAAGERREENIFTCLKTGYFNAAPDEIFSLENYVLMWNIRGEAVFEEYTLNPDGYEEELSQRSAQALEAFNSTRERVMPPLQNFCRRLRGTFSGETFCRTLYSFLLDLQVPTKLDAECDSLRKKGDFVRAEENIRLWELAVNVLDQISLAASTEELTAKGALELFKLACEDADMGRIPPVSDGVTVGAADRIRVADVKRVYIIGANEGVFPASASPGGILTDREREFMKEHGLSLGGDASYWSVEEMFIAYKAFTAASEALTVLFCRSSGSGEKLRPSPLVAMLKKLFPALTETPAESVSPFTRAVTKSAALSVAASAWNSGDVRIEELKRYLTLQSEYASVIETMKSGRKASAARIADADIAQALFGKNMRMSASKLEIYHKCRYEFFMKYGLLLRPRVKLSLRADSAGTFVHYVLENGLRELTEEDISTVTVERLKECVEKWSGIYYDKIMGGGSGKSAGFVYLLGRLKKLVLAVLENICAEMRQSRFRPAAFELSLSKDGDVSPYDIPCENGSVSIEGKVDRVDKMYDEEGFVRVVDYKTGCKEFKLNDILYGLNMQMLIYLFALRSGSDEYRKLQPGGVLYYPAARRTYSAETGESADELNKKQASAMRMNGILLEDIRCIQGMESELERKFIPVGINKKGELTGGVIVTEDQLQTISDYIDALLRDMHAELTSGNISALPIKGCGNDACRYCDYASVCGRDELTDPAREMVSRSTDEAMRGIELMSKGGGNGAPMDR